jgi:hypothetical protein
VTGLASGYSEELIYLGHILIAIEDIRPCKSGKVYQTYGITGCHGGIYRE